MKYIAFSTDLVDTTKSDAIGRLGEDSIRYGMGSFCSGSNDFQIKDGTDNFSTNYYGNFRRVHVGVSRWFCGIQPKRGTPRTSLVMFREVSRIPVEPEPGEICVRSDEWNVIRTYCEQRGHCGRSR